MTETTHEALLRQTATAEELLAYFQAQRDQFQADVAEAQGDYAALAADLDALIGSRMDFTATIDPDEAAPTNVDGGTFTTIKAAIDAAPKGSFVTLSLAPGKTFPIDADIYIFNRTVHLIRNGGGANPVIAPGVISTGSHNALTNFRMWFGHLMLTNCDVQFPGKVDAGLPWSSTCTLVQYRTGSRVSVGVINGEVTSSEAEHGLASAKVGTHVVLGIYNSTLDGPLSAVRTANGGVVEISQAAVTLLNGASLTDAGTIGVNILQN